MAYNAGDIVAHLKANTVDFQKGMAQAQHSTNSFGNGLKKFSKIAAVGIAAAGVAAVAFGVKSVKAYSEAEKASKQLEHAVLQVTKANRKQLKQTEDLADALEKKGVLDGDNIKMGLAQLSTFGLSNKAVQRLGGSLSDLAVNQFGVSASGEQLSDTANMIAKALNGQFGVLEKSGIRFNDAQKHAIEFGTEMEKVDAINKGFAQNLKFTNDVALTTTEGKLAKLKVSFENIQEGIGQVIVNALTPLATNLSNFVASDKFQAWVANLNAWLAVNLPLAINWLKDEGLPFLQSAFNALWPVINLAFNWMKTLISFINDHKWVIYALAAAFVYLKTVMIISSVVRSFQAGMGMVRAAYITTRALLVVPIPIAIVVGAALLAMGLIIAKGKETIGVLNQLKDAQTGAVRASEEAGIKGLQQLARNGTPAQKSRAKKSLAGLAEGRATGGPVEAGVPYTVGEVGRELFVPQQNGTIVPSNALRNIGSSISNNIGSITINKDADGEYWLNKLTRNDELISRGMSRA